MNWKLIYTEGESWCWLYETQADIHTNSIVESFSTEQEGTDRIAELELTRNFE